MIKTDAKNAKTVDESHLYVISLPKEMAKAQMKKTEMQMVKIQSPHPRKIKNQGNPNRRRLFSLKNASSKPMVEFSTSIEISFSGAFSVLAGRDFELLRDLDDVADFCFRSVVSFLPSSSESSLSSSESSVSLSLFLLLSSWSP